MDIKEQTRICLEKIRLALEEAGSSLENIVKTVIFVKDMRHYDIIRETEFEYYKKYAPKLLEEPPASTFVEISKFSKPEMLIEIDVIAVK